MSMTKTHVFSLVSSLFAVSAMPLTAQIQFSLSSRFEYRQNKEGIKFRGGDFDVRMSDGSVTTISFCDDPNYFGPGVFNGVCSPGTTGFLSEGTIAGSTTQRPYLLVTSLTNALVVEPYKEQFVSLTAAPASTLPRPSGGFKDNSASIYYNLTTSETEEYKITKYGFNKKYSKNERQKFADEIVPGVYQYLFPSLVPVGQDFVFKPAAISANIYPMVEGFEEVNKREQGLRFISVNDNKWHPEGYIELNVLRPNVIKWRGLDPTTAYAGVDSLWISVRSLQNPKKPETSGLVARNSIFPGFDNERESRVLLRTPYQSAFTLPPIFPSGTRGMVELELTRNFQTGVVTYDYSTRKFQIPVIAVNRFTDYIDISLSSSNQKSLLADPDGDGYNNLTEWILGSSGSDRASIPIAPIPAPFQKVTAIGTPTAFGSYYGFNVNIQKETVPKVKYILQRSLDQGKTWEEFKEGYYLLDGSFSVTPPPLDPDFGFFFNVPYNWSVQKVTTTIRGLTYTEFQVRSGYRVPDEDIINANNWFIQPPDTVSHLYRVKIVLQKTKDKGKGK